MYKFCVQDLESLKYPSLSSTVGVCLPVAGMTINHVSFQCSYTYGTESQKNMRLQSSACSLCCLPQLRCGRKHQKCLTTTCIPAIKANMDFQLIWALWIIAYLSQCGRMLALSESFVNMKLSNLKIQVRLDWFVRGTNFVCMEGCFRGMRLENCWMLHCSCQAPWL